MRNQLLNPGGQQAGNSAKLSTADEAETKCRRRSRLLGQMARIPACLWRDSNARDVTADACRHCGTSLLCCIPIVHKPLFAARSNVIREDYLAADSGRVRRAEDPIMLDASASSLEETAGTVVHNASMSGAISFSIATGRELVNPNSAAS